MGSESQRELVLKQLEEWWERQYVGEGAERNLISSDRWKVYQVLSGCLRRTDSVDGRPLYGDAYGVAKDMDWKRAFAMQYWYACPQNCVVRDALPKYDQCWMSAASGNVAAPRESRPPLPPFVERNGLEDMHVFDTCYYLMWLRQQPEQPPHVGRVLSSLLSPAAYASTWMDYNLGASHQLSWHLCTALFSLAHNSSSDLYRYTELVPTSTYHTIVRNFAMELEAQGLWQLAVFVLLHLPGFACFVRDPDTGDVTLLPSDSLDVRIRDSLAHAVRDILCRHAPDVADESLWAKLGIPEDWLYEAKALRALSEGNDREQAEALLCMSPGAHFLAANVSEKGVHEQWLSASYVRCHNLLKQRLLPAAVGNLDDSLREILEQLRAVVESGECRIEGWESQGQAYYEYLVELDMVSEEWKQRMLEGTPEEIEYAKEKLRGVIGALAARTSAAEASGVADECNTISRFARTTMLTRMVKAYLQLEEASTASLGESVDFVDNMLPFMDITSTYRYMDSLTATYLQAA